MFTTQQIAQIKSALAFHSEGGVTVGNGIFKFIVGFSKTQDKKGNWGDLCRCNKDGYNYAAFKDGGYSGFVVFLNGKWVDLDSSNAHIAGLWAMVKKDSQGNEMTRKAGNVHSIMHCLEQILSDADYATVKEIVDLIESCKVEKFGDEEIAEPVAAAANAPQATLPKTVIATWSVPAIREYIGGLFPSIPESALKSMTKQPLLDCIQ